MRKKESTVEKFYKAKETTRKVAKNAKKVLDDYTTIFFADLSKNGDGDIVAVNFVKVTRNKDSIDIEPDEFVDFTVKLLRVTANGTKNVSVGRGRSRIKNDSILKPMIIGGSLPDEHEIIIKFGEKHMQYIAKGRFGYDDRIKKEYRALIDSLV